jgi:hypothetical protein
MITKSKVVIVAMAVMLIGATAIASEDAFAKKGNSKSQAATQSNVGNGVLPEYVYCQNTASQTQGEDNTVGIFSNQG